jgi:hypothetical protein
MDPPDELEDYLRRDSALSRQYGREPAPMPPHALDRRVLKFSRDAQGNAPYLAPLALAASVLLSVALVLAIAFGPQSAKRADDTPHLVRVAARADSDAHASLTRKLARAPSDWLADIAALRRAGRNNEADAELRRFHSTYPDYAAGELRRRPGAAP